MKKLLEISLICFLIVTFQGCNQKKIGQNDLKNSVIEYSKKFEQAKKITVILHNPVHGGEELQEIRKYELTGEQRELLLVEINKMSRKRLSYNEPSPISLPYNITIFVESLGGDELITISENCMEITAYRKNPFPVPVELPIRLHSLLYQEFH